MDFPAGRTILLIVLFASVGASGILVGLPMAQRPDQVVWVFDPSHRDTYSLPSGGQPSLLALHQQQTGHSVEVQLMPSRVLDARLLSLILSNARGDMVPDLVEIEIGSVGKYFRAPANNNGLLPLDDFVAKDLAARDLSPARLATWSHEGPLFGIPRDVHPVTITFRRDLFEIAGIDLSTYSTWQEFRDQCLRYQRYWAGKSQRRWAMQLSRWNASDLIILLQQQRVSLIDTQGRPDLSDPRIATTVAFYAQLVSGPEAISTPVPNSIAARDLADGDTAALLTPDWRIEYLRDDPALINRLGMMPLPRFADGDARTASWGGTMVAIPRNARDPQASWRLLRDLQLTPEALKARQYHSSILSARESSWNSPAFSRPDPLFGGQPIQLLYAQLARELPLQRVSPYSTIVAQSLAGVLSEAQSYLEQHGIDGLEDFCRERLIASQAQLRRMADFAEAHP